MFGKSFEILFEGLGVVVGFVILKDRLWGCYWFDVVIVSELNGFEYVVYVVWFWMYDFFLFLF